MDDSKKSKRFDWILAVLLALTGILLTVFAVPPSIWGENIGEWVSFVITSSGSILSFIFGFVLAVAIFRLLDVHRGTVRLRSLSNRDYNSEFRKFTKSGKFPIIKIFGYTGEVVTSDLIGYLDRYRSGLEVRMLHRNWTIERSEEENHNLSARKLGFRKWAKSEAIKSIGSKKWDHSLKREIRYYDHQPIFKGVIFCDSANTPQILFFNFLKWVPLPVEGGSQFKSVPSQMLAFEDANNALCREILDRINSQFEFEWSKGLSVDQLLRKDMTQKNRTQE